MGIADRLLTIAVTATVTSAAWIVAAGTGLVDSSSGRSATTGAGDTVLPTPGASPIAATSDGRLLIPVSGVAPSALTDTFTQARAGGARVHDAIDIMAPRGTPVLAAAPGTVEKLFLSNDGGNTVYVRSDDRRTIHYYAHLDAYASGLTEGMRVERGQILGTVGSTGNASEAAPHLHFAILQTTPTEKWWEAARPINPYPLLGGR